MQQLNVEEKKARKASRGGKEGEELGMSPPFL
jgi:hypothetical protein